MKNCLFNFYNIQKYERSRVDGGSQDSRELQIHQGDQRWNNEKWQVTFLSMNLREAIKTCCDAIATILKDEDGKEPMQMLMALRVFHKSIEAC